jgi:hypothetical protein
MGAYVYHGYTHDSYQTMYYGQLCYQITVDQVSYSYTLIFRFIRTIPAALLPMNRLGC